LHDEPVKKVTGKGKHEKKKRQQTNKQTYNMKGMSWGMIKKSR
jgi:hypothetical protein